MLSMRDLVLRSGLKAPTIRRYEEIGLLDDVARTRGGQRRYAEEDLARLLTIRHARALGLGIAEIRQLLDLDDGRLAGEAASAATAGLARALDARRRRLDALAAQLGADGPRPPGALGRALAGEDEDAP